MAKEKELTLRDHFNIWLNAFSFESLLKNHQAHNPESCLDQKTKEQWRFALLISQVSDQAGSGNGVAVC